MYYIKYLTRVMFNFVRMYAMIVPMIFNHNPLLLSCINNKGTHP